MTILAKVKNLGLNPLKIKVITTTVLNKPATFLGTQQGVDWWINEKENEVYRLVKEL